MPEIKKAADDPLVSSERRDFLAKAGRFGVATPLAVTVLLSTSLSADAAPMRSGGGVGRGGGGRRRNRRRRWGRIRRGGWGRG